MEQYKYKNITFNYTEGSAAEYTGACDNDTGLGWTMLSIPTEHIIGMKRDGYYKEAEYKGRSYRIPPHTEIEDYKDEYSNSSVNSDLIQSINTDLHIVYFKWMLSHPRKKFEIDIMCDNSYFIFHDIAHEDDVQGCEVCCLSARLEEHRLEQGVQLMLEAGYTPEFTEEYYERMRESFYNRWRVSLDHNIFKQYVKKEEYEFDEE